MERLTPLEADNPSLSPEKAKEMEDVWKLRDRGWTQRMIEILLGEPGWILSGWGNISKRAYRSVHVEAIEAGSQFREMFLASAKRRKLDKAFIKKILMRSSELEHSGAPLIWKKVSDAIKSDQERALLASRLAFEAKQNLPPPIPSKLVCRVDVTSMFDDWTVSIHFQRHAGVDRVYCEKEPSYYCEKEPSYHCEKEPSYNSARCETEGTELEGVAKLLPSVLDSLKRYEGPVEFASPGMVDEGIFAKVIDELQIRLAKTEMDNLEQANVAIVSLARELGLAPSPSTESSGIWDARCPGTGHGLILNTARNEFYCGYCKRSGDLGGLRSFVEDRK